MPTRLPVLLAFALAALPAAARPFPPAVITPAEEASSLPLVAMPGDPARLYVRIVDPVLGERVFFVDTAYSRTTCDDDFVAALGLTPARTCARARGELGTVRLKKALLPGFSLGGQRVEGLTCAVRDLSSTSSVVSAPGMETAGVIGADLLGRFVVGIDPAAGVLTLSDPAREAVAEGPGVVPLRWEHRRGPRLRLPVLVDGRETWPLLDTGATRTQLDAGRLGLPLVAEREGVDRGTGADNETTRTFRFHRAASVVVAGQQVGPLRVLDRPRARAVPGLLGQDVLGRFALRIDATHGWAELLPPAPPPPPPPPPEEPARAAPASAASVVPVLVAVPEAAGPPALDCREALGLAPRPASPPPRPDAPPPGPPHVSPDPGAMPQVEVDGAAADVAALPGADPAALPLQPLEGAPEVLAAIGAVLARAEAGERVRFSFFGASHTAGEFWTGHLRRLLQERYGDAGHGFVLPAALYRGDRAQDVNLCRTAGWRPDWAGRREGHGDGLLGPGGMSVSSSDPADFGWLETTHSNPQGRAVAFFDVYALGQPGGGTLRLTVDEAEAREVPTVAEAPELLRFRVEVPDGSHRLTVAPAGDGEVRLFGVSMERPGPGALVDAMGVRGKEARTWLAWDEDMAARGLASLAPDLVVLAYGTNEANDARYELDAYRADLTAVLVRLHDAVPEAACLLVGPSDRFVDLKHDRYAIWDRTVDFARVQREVALAEGCAFWDWQQASGGPGSMLAWRLHDPELAARDGIHFTRAGYELSAERLLEAMDGVR